MHRQSSMLTAFLMPVFLLTAAPNISSSPAQNPNQAFPYNFSISSGIISPDSNDNLLSDITIAYTLKDKISVSFKLTQNGKTVFTIAEKPNQPPGDYKIIWGGKDETGNYVVLS